MLSIRRFAPFDPYADLFRGLLVRPLGTETPTPAQFHMDVTENHKEYRVLAEIPGVRKEDINVSVNGDEVEISAEVTRDKEAKEGDTVLRSERYYGKVRRAFTLGQELDEAAAQAKYTDGVLELTLPKKAPVAAKKLSIH